MGDRPCGYKPCLAFKYSATWSYPTTARGELPPMLCLLQIKASQLRPFKARPCLPPFNFQISPGEENRHNSKRGFPDLVAFQQPEDQQRILRIRYKHISPCSSESYYFPSLFFSLSFCFCFSIFIFTGEMTGSWVAGWKVVAGMWHCKPSLGSVSGRYQPLSSSVWSGKWPADPAS